MRDQLAETLVGAAVLAVAAVFLTFSFNASGRSAAGYPIVAEFPSVDGLTVGSDVRIAGVKVGAVSAITLDPITYNANVELTLRDGVEVPIDSSIALRADGLLGGVSLEIAPGAEEAYLAAGDRFLEPGQGAIDVIRLLADFVVAGAD